MDKAEVIQIGNIVDDSKIGFKNPQRGRVYSINGIAPCLNCCGGGLVPKIVVYETERVQIPTIPTRSK